MASTEDDAVAAAREELGSRAIVLQSTRTRDGQCEVIAVANPNAPEPGDFQIPIDGGSWDARAARTLDMLRPDSEPSDPPAKGENETDNESEEGPPKRTWERRARTDAARSAYGLPPGNANRSPSAARWATLRERLEGHEVGDDLIELILERVRSRSGQEDVEKSMERVVASALGAFVKVAPPVSMKTRPTVIACVGPTGVGKTTTIAKLATNYKLREGKRVALLTADAYRVGGADQLGTYAKILQAPCRVVSEPREVEEALRAFESCDAVLLDTPGGVPQDGERLSELAMTIKAANPTETHLMVACSTRESDLWQVARAYHNLRPNRLIFSKLDESFTYGTILNFARHAALPISYLTTGQTVPDALEPATLERLAALVVTSRKPFYC